MKFILVANVYPLKACTCLLALLLLWAKSAVATDNHAYRADEYAIISGGQSPDGRWSIAAHGDDDIGYNGFRLYLMHEPTHEELTSLRTGDHLDTAPLSIVAFWAPDSGHVVILYRTDRHVLDVRLFSVTDGKARAIEVPSLVNTIGRAHFKPNVRYELFSRLYRITWPKPNLLVLEEFDTFDATEPIFRPGLKPYLKMDRLGVERTFTDFSASAMCEITKNNRLRLSEVKPLPDWEGTIVYSPHLRFDPQLGLHDTETTMSSMAGQKGQQ